MTLGNQLASTLHEGASPMRDEAPISVVEALLQAWEPCENQCFTDWVYFPQGREIEAPHQAYS